VSEGRKFDPARAARLNDPERLELLDPAVLWAAVGVRDPHVLVDVGTGAGLMAVAFARLAPAATVFAVDVSEEMLAYLVSQLPTDLSDRVLPILSEEDRIPLADEVADLVAMISVYHEFDDPAAMLVEGKRLLAPGGRLLIVDWKKEVSETGPPMGHRVAATEIAAQVEKAGFHNVEIDDRGLAGLSIVVADRPSVRPPDAAA
jgi:ubiquinone/menaquinone biosynthesis C-methylase UbiE